MPIWKTLREAQAAAFTPGRATTSVWKAVRHGVAIQMTWLTSILRESRSAKAVWR